MSSYAGFIFFYGKKRSHDDWWPTNIPHWAAPFSKFIHHINIQSSTPQFSTGVDCFGNTLKSWIILFLKPIHNSYCLQISNIPYSAPKICSVINWKNSLDKPPWKNTIFIVFFFERVFFVYLHHVLVHLRIRQIIVFSVQLVVRYLDIRARQNKLSSIERKLAWGKIRHDNIQRLRHLQ